MSQVGPQTKRALKSFPAVLRTGNPRLAASKFPSLTQRTELFPSGSTNERPVVPAATMPMLEHTGASTASDEGWSFITATMASLISMSGSRANTLEFHTPTTNSKTAQITTSTPSYAIPAGVDKSMARPPRSTSKQTPRKDDSFIAQVMLACPQKNSRKFHTYHATKILGRCKHLYGYT